MGLARSKRRSGDAPADRFEAEPAQFFERVRAAYLQLAHEEPQRVRVIDAAQTLPQVRAQIESLLQSLFE
jgi:dTMP kinase